MFLQSENFENIRFFVENEKQDIKNKSACAKLPKT